MEFLSNKDVCLILRKKQTTAHKIIKSLNEEMVDKGYWIVPGYVNKMYFAERYNLTIESIDNILKEVTLNDLQPI
ncbi:hypothetical protein [Listeria ivanovii]|uniref:hypothetical protein n=1 Tax=Listeria ivanovii TaxID=1638 RepID=UPI001942519A|nr:hypothetical protein [Listeria ivanovii]